MKSSAHYDISEKFRQILKIGGLLRIPIGNDNENSRFYFLNCHNQAFDLRHELIIELYSQFNGYYFK